MNVGKSLNHVNLVYCDCLFFSFFFFLFLFVFVVSHKSKNLGKFLIDRVPSNHLVVKILNKLSPKHWWPKVPL